LTPLNQPAVSRAPRPPVDEALPRLYRRGIAGCREQDAGEVGQVLMQLIAALNFEYEAAASRLFEVYDDCLRRVALREFAEPQRILEGLQRACAPPTAKRPLRAWRGRPVA